MNTQITPLINQITPENWISKYPEWAKTTKTNTETTDILQNFPPPIVPFVAPPQIWIPEYPGAETQTIINTTIPDINSTDSNQSIENITQTLTQIYNQISTQNLIQNSTQIYNQNLTQTFTRNSNQNPIFMKNSTKIIENTTKLNSNKPNLSTTKMVYPNTTEFNNQTTHVEWPNFVDLNNYNTTALKGLNCTEKYKKMTVDLASNFMCDCDPGHLRNRDGKCVRAKIVTFRARLSKLCDVRAHNFFSNDFESQIIQMKVSFLHKT